jgi:hypothetical protein
MQPATDERATSMESSESKDILRQGRQVLPMGDYLKLQLVQHKVLPTCTVSLFENIFILNTPIHLSLFYLGSIFCLPMEQFPTLCHL